MGGGIKGNSETRSPKSIEGWTLAQSTCFALPQSVGSVHYSHKARCHVRSDQGDFRVKNRTVLETATNRREHTTAYPNGTPASHINDAVYGRKTFGPPGG